MSKTHDNYRRSTVRWTLVLFDFVIYTLAGILILVLYNHPRLDVPNIFFLFAIYLVSWLLFRFIFQVYRQIWRYGGIQSYILILMSDSAAFLLFYFGHRFLPVTQLPFVNCLSLYALNLLGALSMRMFYRYAFKCGSKRWFWRMALKVFGIDVAKEPHLSAEEKTRIAIIGAGRAGTNLADDLSVSHLSPYKVCCFVDVDQGKIGRKIHNLPVISEDDLTALEDYDVKEIVLALPNVDAGRKKELYQYYRDAGFRVKTYDYPTMQNAGQKVLREFDIEELLFRKPIAVRSDDTPAFYRDKVIMITGGGGSIGSEICRQLARFSPKQLIILDIYENGAYDLQQELRMQYGAGLDVQVEIVSVANRSGLERSFKKFHPQIVVMAAAHKHVPLMEANCIEAVENNVFGTLNTAQLSIQYGVGRVIMVSTDKAVNPTNIMGATKRFCEMIAQSLSSSCSGTTFSATRFGNVLGSAGSVVPLFRRQIAAGGPVTITDKRIIRYFMTIPEASQLVLESGALAKNGELFVLDMGHPVKILDLAEQMIRLSGMEPGEDIQIVETGLRPGEKLYEELLVQSETLSKTENKMIFIEQDAPLPWQEILQKLGSLQEAIATGSDEAVRRVMREVVPTYHPQAVS